MGFQPSLVARGAPNEPDSVTFRNAMRHLAGGVSVITVGQGENRTGLTATSFSALSTEPPRVIFCVNRQSSSYSEIAKAGQFGVNILAAHQEEIAGRFSGRGGIKGADRYVGGAWKVLSSGVSILTDALAGFDCEVEEVIERHSHAIIIGKVRAIHAPGGPGALLYWRGGFDQLGWTVDQAEKAVGL